MAAKTEQVEWPEKHDNKVLNNYKDYKKLYTSDLTDLGMYILVNCWHSDNHLFIYLQGYSHSLKQDLRYVVIKFDVEPYYDRVIKDRAAKPVDMLSAIGGTMGLLTGFSLISGAEIIYFAVKIFLSGICKRCKKRKEKEAMPWENW